MSTTIKIGYLKSLRRMGRKSLTAKSVFGFPYRISLGDNFSENPFYNDKANVGEVLATAAWVSGKQYPIIYDVGAHCGFIASQIAAILKKQHPVIYSFEPVAPTFSDLVQTVVNLDLQEIVKPVAVALSNSPGFVKLNYSKSNSMLAQIINQDEGNNNRSGNQVYISASETLDNCQLMLGLPDVIKIDVEGWEVNVFQGAKKLLGDRTVRDMGICLEWNPDAINQVGSSTSELYQCLKNFTFYYLNDYEGQKFSELERVNDPCLLSHVCNLFAIHKESNREEAWKKEFIRLKTHYAVRVS